MLSRPGFYAVCALLAVAISTATSCSSGSGSKDGNPYLNDKSAPAAELEPQVIVDWMEILYYHIANQRISPPQASRIYAYANVILYETLLPGMPGYQSLTGQLNDMPELPRPDSNLEYDWLSAVNEAYYQGINFLLERDITGEVENLDELLERNLEARREAGISEEVMERSRSYGRSLALAVEEWAKMDGFDKSRLPTTAYKTPSREGQPQLWEPTDFGQTPLEPYWGTIRPFAMAEGKSCGIQYGASEGTVPSTIPEFSTEPGSPFYEAARAVYEKDRNVTEEERVIALYWADDPGETSTPPGHWVYIMNDMIKARNLTLDQAAEMYALTCVAMADAFISVWYTKYKVNLVRPKTYIREFMGEPGWEPWVETPPFPEYASGHSGVSGAAATVLTDILGDQPFVDSVHRFIGLPNRSFDNFWQAAMEAAESRYYGGIHYRFGIDDALGQGRCAGETVLENVKTRIEEEQ
jgi:hypothetical protein